MIGCQLKIDQILKLMSVCLVFFVDCVLTWPCVLSLKASVCPGTAMASSNVVGSQLSRVLQKLTGECANS